MSKLAIVYINKPFSVRLQPFRWVSPQFLIKFSGAYGSIYYIFLNNIYLHFFNKSRFFVRIDPIKKDTKKFLGLFFSLILASILDISLSYKLYLEMRGVGFKFYRKGRCIFLDAGFSHQVCVPIPENIFARVLNKKNTKILIRTFHRQLAYEFATILRSCRIPNEYTLKGIHYRNVWIKKKPGKQTQQK